MTAVPPNPAEPAPFCLGGRGGGRQNQEQAYVVWCCSRANGKSRLCAEAGSLALWPGGGGGHSEGMPTAREPGSLAWPFTSWLSALSTCLST